MAQYLEEIAARSDIDDLNTTMATRALNEGKNRMQPYLKLTKTTDVAVTGDGRNQTYTLPTDLYRLVKLWYVPTDTESDPVPLDRVHGAALPCYAYREEEGQVVVSSPSTGSIGFEYDRKVADLVDDDDTFDFPEVWQDIPMLNALRVAKEQDTEFEEAAVFARQFADRMDEMQSERAKDTTRRPRAVRVHSWT